MKKWEIWLRKHKKYYFKIHQILLMSETHKTSNCSPEKLSKWRLLKFCTIYIVFIDIYKISKHCGLWLINNIFLSNKKRHKSTSSAYLVKGVTLKNLKFWFVSFDKKKNTRRWNYFPIIIPPHKIKFKNLKSRLG